MTKTIGVVPGTVGALPAPSAEAACVTSSLRVVAMTISTEGGVQCLEQSRLAEWLEQAGNGALLEQPLPSPGVGVGGDEDDRNAKTSSREFSLEIRARHPWHDHVQNQAPGLMDEIGSKERLRGRERLNGEMHLAEQIGERFSDRLIIVHDRDEWTHLHRKPSPVQCRMPRRRGDREGRCGKW